MVGGTAMTPEFDLLSLVYSAVLKAILFFTGNIVTVPFVFQIACFTIFMICGFFTVKKLLGTAASLVFTAYVAFMPVFTYKFTGLLLSTDSLFMAMFGIELFVMALFLRGAYRKVYNHTAFVLWYLVVGAVVGFMAYVDAGTIIMILPFLLAVLFIKGTSFKEEIVRLLFVLFGAVIAFTGMIVQEQGIIMSHVTLTKWASFYFHNLNTFSMFWTYTDHKIAYLVTAVAMSGVIVGFWKNRNFDKISPWLLSMLFIFATVPFMGATRMNTQVFVTVYYAFILACVTDLIATPADETADDPVDEDTDISVDDAKELTEEPQVVRPEVVSPQFDQEETSTEFDDAAHDDTFAEESEWPEHEKASEDTAHEDSFDTRETEHEDTFGSEESKSGEETVAEQDIGSEYGDPSVEFARSKAWADRFEAEMQAKAEGRPIPESSEYDEYEDSREFEDTAELADTHEPEDTTEFAETPKESGTAESSETPESEDTTEFTETPEPAETAEASEPAEDSDSSEPAEPRQRFVPEGMVLPEDDEDVDLTPRMKMPELRAPIGPDGKAEKLRIRSSRAEEEKNTAPKDDFDIAFVPGDDFDI